MLRRVAQRFYMVSFVCIHSFLFGAFAFEERCFKGITGVSRMCLRVSQGVTKVFKGCFKSIPRMFRGYCHTRLHLGFSAKLRIEQVPASKMEPQSGIIIFVRNRLSGRPADHTTTSIFLSASLNGEGYQVYCSNIK